MAKREIQLFLVGRLKSWIFSSFAHDVQKHKGVEQFVVSVFRPTNVGGPGI